MLENEYNNNETIRIDVSLLVPGFYSVRMVTNNMFTNACKFEVIK